MYWQKTILHKYDNNPKHKNKKLPPAELKDTSKPYYAKLIAQGTPDEQTMWVSSVAIIEALADKSPTYTAFCSARWRRAAKRHIRISYIFLKAPPPSVCGCQRAHLASSQSLESWTTAGDYQVRLLYLVCRYLRVSSVHTLSFSLYTARSRRYILLGIIAPMLHRRERRKISRSVSAACIILALYVTSTTKQGSVFTLICAQSPSFHSCIYIYIYAREATKEIYRCQSRSESFHSLSPPTSFHIINADAPHT